MSPPKYKTDTLFGLRRVPQFEELIDKFKQNDKYLNNSYRFLPGAPIKLPNRDALKIRDSNAYQNMVNVSLENLVNNSKTIELNNQKSNEINDIARSLNIPRSQVQTAYNAVNAIPHYDLTKDQDVPMVDATEDDSMVNPVDLQTEQQLIATQARVSTLEGHMADMRNAMDETERERIEAINYSKNLQRQLEEQTKQTLKEQQRANAAEDLARSKDTRMLKLADRVMELYSPPVSMIVDEEQQAQSSGAMVVDEGQEAQKRTSGAVDPGHELSGKPKKPKAEAKQKSLQAPPIYAAAASSSSSSKPKEIGPQTKTKTLKISDNRGRSTSPDPTLRSDSKKRSDSQPPLKNYSTVKMNFKNIGDIENTPRAILKEQIGAWGVRPNQNGLYELSDGRKLTAKQLRKPEYIELLLIATGLIERRRGRR